MKCRLAKFYKKERVLSRLPLKRFSLRSLKVKKTLKLKAKAGQARCLMRFTLDLAREFQDSDGELGHHRAKAMETLSEILNFSKKSKFAMEVAQCTPHVLLHKMWLCFAA